MSSTREARAAFEATIFAGVLETPLSSSGPRTNATAGAPVEAKHVIFSDRTTEIGIWEVTPGTFPARKVGVCELMHFVAGAGTIADERGLTEIGPGVVMFTPDGWSGTWEVRETVRKVYVLHRTQSRPVQLARLLAERLRRLKPQARAPINSRE